MKKLFVFLCTVFIGVAFAHTIEWYVDDQIISTTTCNSGDNITPPTAPAKYGYSFTEWEAMGYRELQYIESTGTQYIDTGVPARYGNRYIIKAAFTELSSSDRVLIGSLQTDNAVHFGVDGSGKLFLRAVTLAETDQGVLASTNTIYTYDLLLEYENTVCTVKDNSGTTLSSLHTAATETPNSRSLYLFADNYDGSAIRVAKAKMYYAKNYNTNNVLVRNFIPAKRNSDNAIGMYDTVTGTFFENIGTGTFIAGPEVGAL